ncbi:MAG TPA: metallophosphoesterase [Polyangiaceae bacterium]|jgi:hypothetical protein
MTRLTLCLCAAILAASPDAAAATPKLQKGPYLVEVTDTAVDVRFELDTAVPADVELRPAGAAGDAAAARTVVDGSASMHSVHATGLEPATAYEYAVRVGGAVAGTGRFVTAPRDDAKTPVTFLVYGDVRSGEATQAAIVRAMKETPSDFLVNTGDIVAAGGSAADWQEFFQLEEPLLRDRPLFLCIGNHELSDDQAGTSFARYFGFDGAGDGGTALLPYGTTRWGNARFFFLNGMHDWKQGGERAWLERELTRSDTEPGLVWRIAVVHHSAWSSGPHGGNAKLLDAKIPELLAAHKVDLVLAGHDHIYERGEQGGSTPIKYVITGGGGAPLYPIEHRLPSTRKAESTYHFVEVTLNGTALRLVAHRLDGTILDSCGFTQGQPWDCDAPAKTGPSLDPTGQAPADPVAASSRCGCTVPGARVGVALGAWLALAGVVVAGVARVRRRRG